MPVVVGVEGLVGDVGGGGEGVFPAAWQRVAMAWHGGDIELSPLAAARVAW